MASLVPRFVAIGFLFVGYLKSKIYVTQSSSLEDLCQCISSMNAVKSPHKCSGMFRAESLLLYGK